MSGLFNNALISIKLGVEDHQTDDEHRAVSAARNGYVSILPLAKETPVRRAPNADMDKLLAAKYKPMRDRDGNIEIVPDGHRTIDFHEIAALDGR